MVLNSKLFQPCNDIKSCFHSLTLVVNEKERRRTSPLMEGEETRNILIFYVVDDPLYHRRLNCYFLSIAEAIGSDSVEDDGLGRI